MRQPCSDEPRSARALQRVVDSVGVHLRVASRHAEIIFGSTRDSTSSRGSRPHGLLSVASVDTAPVMLSFHGLIWPSGVPKLLLPEVCQAGPLLSGKMRSAIAETQCQRAGLLQHGRRCHVHLRVQGEQVARTFGMSTFAFMVGSSGKLLSFSS